MKGIYAGLVSALATLLAVPAAAATGGVTLSFTATSDYVFRGVSQSAGHGALQVGVDYQHRSGLFGGLWASSTDLAPSVADGTRRTREVDLYAGYALELPGDWASELTLVHYGYPRSTPTGHYDYTELANVVHFRDTVSLATSYTRDAFGRAIRGFSWDLTVRYPLPARLVALGGYGVYDLAFSRLDRYAFWSVGLARSFGPLTADLSFFSLDRAGRHFYRERGGDRLVLSLTAAVRPAPRAEDWAPARQAPE